MIEELPKQVKHYIFIKHEDLVNDFKNTMNKLKDTGLRVKPNIQFPLNWIYYKDLKNELYQKNQTVRVRHIISKS